MSSPRPESRSELLARLRVDQFERWRRGESVPVEFYLEQYPFLADDAEAVLRLVTGEVLHRLEAGDHPGVEEYVKRFPRDADAIRRAWPQLPTPPRAPDSHVAGTTCVEPPAGTPAPRPPLSLPGFELLEVLGEGGMGLVYKARDVRLNQLRAVKVIGVGHVGGERTRQRFHREAQAVARLDHPGVVRIHALGEHESTLYICMEFLPGGSLRERLQQGPLEVREAAELVRQLALAVQHAHENHVLHRDLKPANVLLTTSGLPKVADFGLAKLLDVEDDLTHTGAVIGTPSYMAPEQAEGRHGDVREATDVWALGAILYECLTGRPAFKAPSRSETLEQVKRQLPAPPRRLRAEVPAELEAVCLRCLQKRPERRYAAAGELAADLQAFLDGRPVRARSDRRRAWLAAALAALAVTGLAAGLTLALLPRADDQGPGKWRRLLTREPVVLRWPEPGAHSFREFSPQKGELRLSCEELGLLALGETVAPRYKLAVTVQQTPWAGNVGLFFGYKDAPGGSPTLRYETVDLVAGEQRGLFRIDWVFHSHTGPPGSEKKINDRRKASAPFPLEPSGHRLEVTIGGEGLEAVTLDGQPLAWLTAENLDRPPPDFRGRFGVYVNNGSGAFREAEFIFWEGP